MTRKTTRRFAIGALVISGLVLFSACKPSGSAVPSGSVGPTDSAGGTGITFTKSDITDKAAFIPYQAGKTKMEVIAVRAPDDTIRTALNTCQVCYDSGRGYYVQSGDRLVCQNCGNQFKISQVEKQKNGCNPVPILDGEKSDDGKTVTISPDYLDKAKVLFENWKTK